MVPRRKLVGTFTYRKSLLNGKEITRKESPVDSRLKKRPFPPEGAGEGDT